MFSNNYFIVFKKERERRRMTNKSEEDEEQLTKAISLLGDIKNLIEEKEAENAEIKAKSITIAEKLHKQDEATRKHFNSIQGIRHRRNEEQQRFSNNVRYY